MRHVVGIHTYPGPEGPVYRVARMKAALKGQSLVSLNDAPATANGDTVAVIAATIALREIDLPFTDPRKAAQVAPFEVDGMVAFDVDEAVVGHELISRNGSGSRLLVAVAPEDHIAELVAREGQTPEQPQVILPEAFALYAFARRALAGHPGPILVVDLRPHRLLLVQVADGVWRGTRTVTCDWNPTATETPTASALASLRRAAQSMLVEGGEVPTAMLVVGEGTGDDGAVSETAAHALAAPIGLEPVPSEALLSLAGELGGPRQDGPGRVGVHALAIGLALAAGDTKRRMNLRAGAFALSEGSEGEAIRRVAGIGVGLLLLLGLAWGDGMVRHHAAQTAYDTARDALETQYRVVFPDAVKVVNPIMQARNQVKKLKARGLLYGSGGTTAMGYLHAVSENIPPELQIDIFEFSVDGTRLRMEAEVLSFDAIDQVKAQLEGRPEFDDVRVSDAKMNAKGNRVKFRVHGTLTEGV